MEQQREGGETSIGFLGLVPLSFSSLPLSKAQHSTLLPLLQRQLLCREVSEGGKDPWIETGRRPTRRKSISRTKINIFFSIFRYKKESMLEIEIHKLL